MAKSLVSDKQTKFDRGDGRLEATSQTPLLPIAYAVGAVNGYVWTTDANGNGSWQAATGGGGGGTSLTRATVLTASGSAAANTVVPVITTSGAVTVTLPNAPAAGTVVAVKCITFGVGNPVTIACAGSDVINTPAGGTTLTLSAANQGVYLCYDLVSGIWTDLADDLPMSYLNTLFLSSVSGGAVGGSVAVTGALSTVPSVLTDASTIAVNAALSDVFRVTLGGNRTLGSPANPVDGQSIVFEVIQDATGSRTLAYGGAYSFPSSIGTPVLSSTPAYHDFIAFRYDSGTTTWYCTGFVPQSVNASPYTVSQGGTGVGSLTAYELIAAGTTTTGAAQQIAAGAAGTVLMGAGGSALPAFTALDSTATDITQTGTAAAAGATGKVPDAGHTHANSLVIPGDFSFAAWTLDPAYCNAAGGASTSIMYLTRFFLRQATTLNDIWLHVVTAPVGTLTSGQNFAMVYDSGGTQRAITADQTTPWTTTGVKEAAFTGSYAAPVGWYYCALNVVVSGGAGPAFRAGATAASSFLANAGLSAATLRVATQTAVAGTPGALTLSSNVQTTAFPICAVFV